MPRPFKISQLFLPLSLVILSVVFFVLPLSAQNFAPETGERPSADTFFNTGHILIGMEYVMPDYGAMLGRIGAPSAKHLGETFEWGKLQKTPNGPIDFSPIDRYVSEYQGAGFRELVIDLKSFSSWGSKNCGKFKCSNPSPKPQYLQTYANYVAAIVERYDGDGKNDMPGLRYPVRIFEIGTEFSSYEPEPVDEYIEVLQACYRAAHAASNRVLIANCAFMITPFFPKPLTPSEYPQYFALSEHHKDNHHGLADMRKVLSRPDIFDLVNFHALNDVIELEEACKWLRYEMSSRNYMKPILISDTIPQMFIAWGPATTCQGPKDKLGMVLPPATEADRCRLADYFSKLVRPDLPTVRWTQAFCAIDTVKKVVVAAEQKVMLIDTSYTEDFAILKWKIFKAGAGLSPWAGFFDVDIKAAGGGVEHRTVKEVRANYYGLQQLVRNITGYTSVRRLPFPDSRVRVYEFMVRGRQVLVAWLEPTGVVLPGDPIPQIPVALQVGSGMAVIEPVITNFGQTQPERFQKPTQGGTLNIQLTPTPVYVYAS